MLSILLRFVGGNRQYSKERRRSQANAEGKERTERQLAAQRSCGGYREALQGALRSGGAYFIKVRMPGRGYPGNMSGEVKMELPREKPGGKATLGRGGGVGKIRENKGCQVITGGGGNVEEYSDDIGRNWPERRRAARGTGARALYRKQGAREIPGFLEIPV